MSISIIVPTWNEARTVVGFIRHLRRLAPDAEVIVVDGGSSDGTPELCQHEQLSVCQAPLGRAQQMNSGARRASGDILWFVHADSKISPGAVAAIEKGLADRQIVGGCFRLEIVPTRWIYRLRDAVGNFCVEHFRIALGDRGFFCRREIFLQTGGYPEIPLLEDAEFYRKLKGCGRVVQLPEKIQTSARRYEALGPARTVFFYGLVMLLYSLGAPLPALEKIVRCYGVKPSRFAGAVFSKSSLTDRSNRRPLAPLKE